MMRFCPLFSIIPATFLLILSFFILFAAGKAGGKGLKTFGRVLAVLLWIYAAAMVSMGAYMTISGDMSMMKACPVMSQTQAPSK